MVHTQITGRALLVTGRQVRRAKDSRGRMVPTSSQVVGRSHPSYTFQLVGYSATTDRATCRMDQGSTVPTLASKEGSDRDKHAMGVTGQQGVRSHHGHWLPGSKVPSTSSTTPIASCCKVTTNSAGTGRTGQVLVTS